MRVFIEKCRGQGRLKRTAFGVSNIDCSNKLGVCRNRRHYNIIACHGLTGIYTSASLINVALEAYHEMRQLTFRLNSS